MNKICHLTTVHHRYDTRIFLKECCSLMKEGFDVTLIVADGKGNEERDGVKIFDIGLPKSRLSRILKFRKKILNKALKTGSDLYHFHDPELLGVGRVLAKKGHKVIYDSHEDVPRQLLTKEYLPVFLRKLLSIIFEAFENRIVKRLSGVVGATPLIRDRFKVMNERTIAVQNFPFLEEFSYVNATIMQKSDSVCYVGAISRVRGIVNMVKAFEHIDNTRLLLGGKFETEQLRQECLNLKGWEKVIELGFLNRVQVQSTLEESVAGLVVLNPTINYLDSIPVKMFEYMAAGIPVIASDFPYWRKLLSGIDCAIFVNPQDSKELAKAIETLVSDKQTAAAMGATGRSAIEERFNWGIEKIELLRLYNYLLAVH